MSSSKDVYSRKRIIAVTRLTIMKKYDYSHLEKTKVRRDDQKMYKFREGDFPRLRLQDIEDMLLLLVQQKLTNLTIDKWFVEAFVPEGLSTYIRMMLSPEALLSTIGVREKYVTVIGATFQWFLRDLTGMLGGVMFTFYQSGFEYALIAEAKHSKKCGYYREKTNKHTKTTCPLNPKYIAKLARIDVDEQAARFDANEQATRIDAAEQATNIS
ncbi:root UVB sensitive 3-like protein isoform X1 [Tanacetum coccineum]